MGRTARDRNRGRPKPVQKIELAANPSIWKGALAVLFLLIGAAALAYALLALLSGESGWQTIEANPGEELTCAQDFVFLYPLGAHGVSASAEARALKALYTDATEAGYRLFTADVAYANAPNVAWLNAHPNEIAEVDPALCAAFERIAQSGDRTLYLGPVLEAYESLFSCADDAMTGDFDPYVNDDLRALYGEIAAYARDPAQIDLRLLGGNQVELFVSDAYLAFAEEQGLERLIDFGFMKNAFVTDYLADTLTAGGYAAGTLSSFDGFARNLDAVGGAEYALNLYDRGLSVAALRYDGARAFCSLRDYPLLSQDDTRFYVYRDGTVRSAYLSVQDGLPHAALRDLTLTSKELSCAQLLLAAIPVYVRDTLDAQALQDLAAGGVHTVYCQGNTLVCTDDAVRLTDVYDDGSVRYTAQTRAD